jgi:hypothetical protein
MKPVIAFILVCIIAAFLHLAIKPEFQPEPLPRSAMPSEYTPSANISQGGVGSHGVIVVFQ